jgi:DNA helicase-2/ATP-dependent DNA helicase PcrA
MKNHHKILIAFIDLKFNMGKKNLISYLKGNPSPTIERNKLDELTSYGNLYDLKEIEIQDLVEILISKKYLEILEIPGGFKVVGITKKGELERIEKLFEIKKEDLEKQENNCNSNSTNFSSKIYNLKNEKITNEEKITFEKYDNFLNGFNEFQKKSIIQNEKNLLCIAGPGTGKTSVLTKRIEFLNKYKNVEEKEILAITFTKKAKNEMKKRLELNGIKKVRIETFNSFCEKVIRTYSHLIYGNIQSRVLEFIDKIKITNDILKKLNIKKDYLIDNYFTKNQISQKGYDNLFFTLMNDFFSIIDIYKLSDKGIIKEFFLKDKTNKKFFTKQIYKIICEINKEVKNRNLRDFSDQILEVNKFFDKTENKKYIPNFKHILVDEFQDINYSQFKLLTLIYKENIFGVGDPRQSIYHWRGSSLKFLDKFLIEFKDTKIIFLKNNYRSNKNIIEFSNLLIEKLKLPNIIHTIKNKEENSIFSIECQTEKNERQIIIDSIKNSKNDLSEIFVLARTNKILEKFGEELSKEKIPFEIKNEEGISKKKVGNLTNKSKLILATIHSIKGQEAKEVYLMGVSSNNFPNKVQDTGILSLVKSDFSYDKYSEELRLFYVAVTRAKEKLIFTYTSNLTPFLTDEMLNLIKSNKTKNKKSFTNEFENPIKNALKVWRFEKAEKLGVPVYMIISNKAIDEISQNLPKNNLELQEINGIGPQKILKYGREILNLI